MQLEARPYEADMTDGERAAIAARVALVDEAIIVWRELPVCTPPSLAVMWNESKRLLHDDTRCVFIFDLREAMIPDARAREALRGYGRRIIGESRHVAAVLGKHVVIGVVARLIAYASGYHDTTFHPTVDAAIAEARRVLAA